MRFPSDSPTQPFWRQAPTLLLFLVILVLAVGLRLRGFGESLWLDELFTSAYFCGHPLVLARTLYTDIHPPAYFVFIHVWIRMFGDGEFWLRLPPLLSGLASLWLIFRLGERYRDHRTGWVAAGLLALSPVHIWYSGEARPYATNMFLLLLTLYAFVRREEEGRARWTALFACGLFGLVFTHYYTAVFLVVFPALAFLRRGQRMRGLLQVSAAIGVLLAGYLGTKASFAGISTGRPYLRGFDLGEAWSLCFDWFLTGKCFTPLLAEEPAGRFLLPLLQGLAVWAFLAGTWRLLRNCEANGHEPVVVFGVLPLCLFAMNLLGMSNTYIERSALPALPFFLLILASGIAGWKRRATGQMVLVTLGVACSLVLCFSLLHERDWTVYKPNPRWRQVTHFLGEEIEKAEGSEGARPPMQLYTSASPLPMSYYDPRIQEVKHLVRNESKVTHLFSTIENVFGKAGTISTGLQSLLESSLDELDLLAADLRENLRVEVRSTAESSPLTLDAEHAPERFWLLHQFGGTRQDRLILRDPRTVSVSKHEFDELTLWQLELRPRPLVQR